MKLTRILPRIPRFRKHTHNRWNRSSFEKFEDDHDDPLLTNEADLDMSFESDSPSSDIYEFVVCCKNDAGRHPVENVPVQFLIHSQDCDSSETSEATPIPVAPQDRVEPTSVEAPDIDAQVKAFFPAWKEEEPMFENEFDAIQELVQSRTEQNLFALTEENEPSEKVVSDEPQPTNVPSKDATEVGSQNPVETPFAASGDENEASFDCLDLEAHELSPFPMKELPENETIPHPFYAKPVKLSVLLLDPRTRCFELIQVLHCPSASSLQGLLSIIQQQASEPALASQTYTGLYIARHDAEITEESLMCVKECHVLVAVPQGYSTEEIAVFAKQLLATKSMSKFVNDIGQSKKKTHLNTAQEARDGQPEKPPKKEGPSEQDSSHWIEDSNERDRSRLVFLLDETDDTAVSPLEHNLILVCANDDDSLDNVDSNGRMDAKGEGQSSGLLGMLDTKHSLQHRVAYLAGAAVVASGVSFALSLVPDGGTESTQSATRTNATRS